MKHYLFFLQPKLSFETATKELKKLGLQDLYFLEDRVTSSRQIGGWVRKEDFIPSSCAIYTHFEEHPSIVDWNQEWKRHAPLHPYLPLKKYGIDQILRLKPGAGFGDLSHPTTRLCLKLLSKNLQGRNFLDIGCGSGILSLSAQKMGAKSVVGVDIDKKALAHAKANLKLNNLNGVCFFSKLLPSLLKKPLLIAMNMTLEEQKIAWKSTLPYLSSSFEIITSGILEEQEKEYLQLTHTWHFHLQKSQKEKNWKAFYFSLRKK